MKLYRFLTGPDDDTFCKRVSTALNTGWELHGQPSLAFDAGKARMICGQAVVKVVAGTFGDDIKLSDY
jgi:hypothetical protein